MGHAPIARVKNYAWRAAQLIWDRQWRQALRKCHRRGVAFQPDPSLRNPVIHESARLVDAQHFKRVDTTPPETCQAQQQPKDQSAASPFGNEALRMEVGDAV